MSTDRCASSPDGEGPPPGLAVSAQDAPEGSETAPAEDSRPIVWMPPPLPPVGQAQAAQATDDRTALAYQFNAPVYASPGSKTIVGFVRRGTEVPIARWVPGEGCKGSWYELATGGYVCNTDGFDTSKGEKSLPEGIEVEPAKVHSPLPFAYAKITTENAPLYWRVPTKDEEAAARVDATARPEPVKERASGAVFVAIERWVEDGARKFAKTPRGYYVAASDLEVRPAPRMRGEALQGAEDLPLAFVHAELAPIVEASSGDPVGMALRHARFPVEDRVEVEGEELVVGPGGHAVPRQSVRIADLQERPDRIPAGVQWLHVDLGEQTLVAYEGDEPVRATLISSGKPGYEPPLGVFRIHKKYVTKTMAGDDDVDGSYEVDQVPWTMYYWGSLALHGAYWHDGFGTVRSHGCTNIPPTDAKWLFDWSNPDLPPGWHGKVGLTGPHILFTNSKSVPSD